MRFIRACIILLAPVDGEMWMTYVQIQIFIFRRARSVAARTANTLGPLPLKKYKKITIILAVSPRGTPLVVESPKYMPGVPGKREFRHLIYNYLMNEIFYIANHTLQLSTTQVGET